MVEAWQKTEKLTSSGVSNRGREDFRTPQSIIFVEPEVELTPAGSLFQRSWVVVGMID